MTHPVVVEVLVAHGQSGAHVVRDGGLGREHLEGIQDASTDDLAIRPALDQLQHQSECLVPDVGVVEPLSRRRKRRQVAQRPDLKGRFGGRVDSRHDPGGVGQQMANGDRRVARAPGHHEPRQVAIDGRVEVDSSLVDQLQDRHRSERLADRADLEQRFGGDRLSRREVCEAVRADRERAVLVGEAERQSRLPAALHLELDGRVDGCHDSVMDHAAIVVTASSRFSLNSHFTL